MTSITTAGDRETQIVYFTNSDLAQRVGGGWRVSVRLTKNGRVISVGRAGVNNGTLHDCRQKGGPKLPSAKLRKLRDMACAAIAARAMGHDPKRIPPQDIDL